MKKNNLINRIFFAKEVKKTQKEAKELIRKINMVSDFLQALYNTDNLYRILCLHRRLWREGFQNANIGPCMYGMFRTSDISKMTSDEVYLGNINGLFTHTLEWWENNVDTEETYDILVKQYRRILTSNINALYNSYVEQLNNLKLNHYYG